jgi:hypothetical protein
VSVSDPAPERRHVPKGKPPQAAQRQRQLYDANPGPHLLIGSKVVSIKLL